MPAARSNGAKRTRRGGLEFQKADGPRFHIILDGQCYLRLDAEHIELTAGDLVVVPRGADHAVADPADSVATPLAAVSHRPIGANAEICHFGGTGKPTLLVCGTVRFAGPNANPLVDLLPPVLLVNHAGCDPAHTWFDATLAILSAAAVALRPGTTAIITRLAEILVPQTVRAWLEDNANHECGWLAAMRDPDIGQALTLIHRRPEDPWTVAPLAREVHLSRSVFSERFTRLVGLSPMQYLTHWRMQLARSWISEDHLSASEVAYRLGYSSESAFSRAFKQHLHMLPGAVRRSVRPAPDAFEPTHAPWLLAVRR